MQQTPEYYEELKNDIKEFWERARSSMENWESSINSLNVCEEAKEYMITNAYFFKVKGSKPQIESL
ncbi:hypothetical protein [Chitinophaga sp. sic0106]|uniref:hypothetical protein n=1 Tax=Chitinophaga sp. sic0106 TaxID=2854785 RepID=UPI001C439E68|nr:hypothetical protein [Chitinophaga sp. sic0106]MBV7532394.1 hypothetical protein [Chitinophaga sp. sic0106]